MSSSTNSEKQHMDEFYRRRSDQLEKDISELLVSNAKATKPNSLDPAAFGAYSPLDSIRSMSTGFGGIVRRSSSLYSDASSIESVGIKTPRRASDSFSPKTPTGFVSASMYFMLNDLSDGVDDGPQMFGTFADFPHHNDLMPVPLFLPSPTDHHGPQGGGFNQSYQDDFNEDEGGSSRLPGALRLRRGGAVTHHHPHDDRRQSTGTLGLREDAFISSRDAAAWQLKGMTATHRHSHQPAVSKPTPDRLDGSFDLKRQWSWQIGDEGEI